MATTARLRICRLAQNKVYIRTKIMCLYLNLNFAEYKLSTDSEFESHEDTMFTNSDLYSQS